jgi:hypothetical protein
MPWELTAPSRTKLSVPWTCAGIVRSACVGHVCPHPGLPSGRHHDDFSQGRGRVVEVRIVGNSPTGIRAEMLTREHPSLLRNLVSLKAKRATTHSDMSGRWSSPCCMMPRPSVLEAPRASARATTANVLALTLTAWSDDSKCLLRLVTSRWPRLPLVAMLSRYAVPRRSRCS